MVEFVKEDQQVEVPDQLPVLPVRDIVVFPYMIIPLFVGREVSINAIERAINSNRMILLLTQKDMSVENPGPDDLYRTGTVAMIMRMLKLPDGRIKILVQGVAKAKVLDLKFKENIIEATIEKLQDRPMQEMSIEVEALVRMVKEHLDRAVSLGKTILPDVMVVIENLEEPG
ncbi:MAG: endopeptidase La, partial [Nitrospirae bacterium]